MRSPKRFLAVLVAVMMTAVTCVPAFAATSETGVSNDAAICASLNLLKGVDANGVTIAYTQTSPTRLQAARILLRLNGLESTATSFTGTKNFKDYKKANTLAGRRIMAYLKAHPELGFSGYTDNTFRPNTLISAKQFYKVILTVLGYVQGVDFEYADLFTFAASKGLTQLNENTVFTIDAMAIAIVEGLRANLADGSSTLIASMVADGLYTQQQVDESGLTGPTPTPTVTATPTETPAELQPLDSTATYLSSIETTSLASNGYTMTTGQVTGFPTITTGIQRIEYDVTPLANNVDGALYLTDGQNPVTGFGDLAMSVRLNSTGTFDVRNGAANAADATVAYTANTSYHVVIMAHMEGKTYSVWVTPAGGSTTQIAANYAFRTTSVDDCGRVLFISAAGNDVQFSLVKRQAVFTPGTIYQSTDENGGWQDRGLWMGNDNTGTVTIEFDATPQIPNCDASVDFADKDTQVGGFIDLCMLVRWNETGTIDVRNGLVNNSQMADTAVSFEALKKYHTKIVADMTAHTYSVWITPEGGVETKIATDYGFRITAADADDVGQCFIPSAWENGRLTMENLAWSSTAYTPTATPTPVPTPSTTATPTPTDTPTPTATPTPTETATPSPTETPAVTATPTQGPNTANVANDTELTAALANSAVGTINFTGPSYAGFIVNYPCVINGAGADVSSGITINISGVTVNNLDVKSSSSLTANPEGEMDYKHAYSIAPNLTGIVISGGSISSDGTDSPINNTGKGIWFQLSKPLLSGEVDDTYSNNGTATITGVTFNNIRNGIVCNGVDSLTVTNCTFVGCRVGIGSTEYSTLTSITGNNFTAAPTNVVEGIGLGTGFVLASGTIDTFLVANNTWDSSYLTALTAGPPPAHANRISDYTTTPPTYY